MPKRTDKMHHMKALILIAFAFAASAVSTGMRMIEDHESELECFYHQVPDMWDEDHPPDLVDCTPKYSAPVMITEHAKRDNIEEKIVTAPPAGTTVTTVTSIAPSSPTATEPLSTFTNVILPTLEDGAQDLPHELIMAGTSAGELLVTTAIVETTVVATVTAIGYSGATSFAILSGGSSESCNSTSLALGISTGASIAGTTTTTCLNNTTTPYVNNSTPTATLSGISTYTPSLPLPVNPTSLLSSALSALSSMNSASRVKTVTSTSTKALPAPATSTLQFGSSSASESYGGKVFFSMLAGVVACFVVALFL